ncbi:serine/threonine-protein kinase [Sandaracinus amylolyticus]|uniref:serine/threonine-protein kinase n=1 Tax=Sandaracinus amylolyticus TaxID=927083 RepID=UPI00146FFC0F|nr:serine/threonine-protein kinase [Sandaracinus amylolyticus]
MSSSREAPRYRLLAPIASGGMGSVDLCVRIEGEFQRLVAVKRLLPLLRVDESVRAMFLDEARIAGLLRHPNVVSVVDVGEDEGGPYLVMDYVDGMSLHAISARLGDEPMPIGIAARIVADCARGLHAAHELRGHDGAWLALVHRDVSPHNVLVGLDGHVRLTDFGISKAVGRQTRTTTGLLKGKLGYMAPEQLRFEEADRRSDVFALGVVLHELLTGARLFSGEPRIVAQKILNGAIPDVRDARPEIPSALAALTSKMLATRPEARPATAEEVALALEEILRAAAIEHSSSDVAAFVSARAGEDRAQLRERIAALVAGSSEPDVAADLEPTRHELAQPETAVATPGSIAARPPARRAVVWALAACFVLTPLAMWALGAAWARDDGGAEPESPRAETAAPEPERAIEPAPAPPVEPSAVTAPAEPDAPALETTPPRSRRRARSRATDPMGRWDWE